MVGSHVLFPMSFTSSGKLDLVPQLVAALPTKSTDLSDNISVHSDLSHISSVELTDPFEKHYNEESIGLHLATWRILATRPMFERMPPKEGETQYERHRYPSLEREDGTKKMTEFRKILQYFLNIAGKRGLKDFPATKFLQECINVADLDKDLRNITLAERLQSQTHPILVSAGTDATFRGLTFKNLPIHNLFDALALTYTLCVTEIDDPKTAELYLYQLRDVANAIKNTGYIRDNVPSTVAASWKSNLSSLRHVVFAFSCAPFGKKKKNSKQRAIENASRQAYCDLWAIHTTKDRSSLPQQYNEAGNCPEFSNWGTICKGAGEYYSLCLAISREKSMKCCYHCKDTANGAKIHKQLIIDDLYAEGYLAMPGDPKSVEALTEKGGYVERDLKRIGDLIEAGRPSKRRKCAAEL